MRHLAHELRQPLSTIEAIAYYLEMVLPPGDAKTRQHVEKLQQVVQQTGWILSDAVHYLQATPPTPQLIELDEFLSRSVADSCRGEPVWIDMDLAPEPTLVNFDPEQLRHLVRNVLVLFRQISRPEKHVTLSTLVHHNEISLRFEAQGVGFLPSSLDAMFEPFGSHLPAGSGFALASVRRIVEAHGGNLELACNRPEHLTLTIVFRNAVSSSDSV